MGRARVHWWTKREDTIHAGINTATTAIVFRPDLLTKTSAERAARIDSIPDPLRRAKFHELLENGLASHTFHDALVVFARLFRDMEAALANGPWLVGQNFTLADGGLASFFFRLEQLDLAGMWREHFPRVTDWYTRMQARPSFQEAIVKYVSDRARATYAKHSEGIWSKVRASFADVLKVI